MAFHRHQTVTLLLTVVMMAARAGASLAAGTGNAGSDAPAAAARVASAELGVMLGQRATAAETRVAELFAERLKDRSDLTLAAAADAARFRLVIGTAATSDAIKRFLAADPASAELGPDGCRIVVDPAKPEWFVAGESPIAVVAGVGRLLRELRYADAAVEVPALDLTERPRMPNRGMYLWARHHFFAKPDQVDRYIEEFALWGCNAIAFWFEMGMFDSFEDPAAQRWLDMYRRFYGTARRMGMKTGLIMVVNDGYKSTPQPLRIGPIIGCPNHYLCPSKPGSVEQAVAWQEQVVKALPPLDIFNLFPADPGGCSCKDCEPWPTRGYWRVAQPLADRIHEISPETEIWVDTWHLNHPTFGGQDWKNLVAGLDWSKERPAWFAGLEVGLAPHHGFARQSAEDRKVYAEAQIPLMVFPDISMWKNHPGMLVKNAYWQELQDELNDYPPELMRGGWPYAERWNTDIASVLFLTWFKDPKTPIDAVLDEWCRAYFGPQAKTARQLLDLLDDGNTAPDRKERIQATLAKLEAEAPAWVRRDWRWEEIVAACRTKSR